MVEIFCRFHASGTRGESKKDFPENDDDKPKDSPKNRTVHFCCFVFYVIGSLFIILMLFVFSIQVCGYYNGLVKVISMTSDSCQAEIRNITAVLDGDRSNQMIIG